MELSEIYYLALFFCFLTFILVYFAFKQHLYRQNYSHIPGPPTKGLLKNTSQQKINNI